MTPLYLRVVTGTRYTHLPDRDGPTRAVAERFHVPGWFTVEVDDPDLDFVLEIDVDNTEGVPRCVALVCMGRQDGPPITGEGLRRVRLASYMRRASDELVGLRVSDRVTTYPLSEDELSDYLRARRRQEREQRRRITPEDLRRVAEVYRTALAHGLPPTAEVEARLRLRSRAQAARWVAKAREAGALGRAPGHRRAGEATGATLERTEAGPHGKSWWTDPSWTRSQLPRAQPVPTEPKKAPRARGRASKKGRKA